MTVELLAPCGSFDALRAAIAGGADAVYLGASSFSARASAANFTHDELIEAIEYAHEYDVSVHLAVNTLLKQDEISQALELVDDAYEAGVDGIIVQDLALLALASSRYPDLSIHASTQMTVHSTSGAKLVSRLGADRVILARELSCDEVKRIARESGVDVELFVHGALCYCYSGQCLFSSFVGGRSGNRGRCAQPCRKPYTLVVEGRAVPPSELGGRYVLSTAELCLLDSLDKVLECQPSAIKLEGRMRRCEYVAGVVDAYRKVLSEGAQPEPLKMRIAHLFYRGFTHGWLLKEDVMHRKHSANRGVLLGVVQSAVRGMVSFVLGEGLELGDGIAVHTRNGVVGTRVRRLFIDGKVVRSASAGECVSTPLEGCTPGDEVYLTADASLLDGLSRMRPRPLGVDVHVEARVGKPLVVVLSDGVHRAVCESGYVVEKSVSSPTSPETLQRIATRLGDTPYAPASFTLEADGDVFVPIGVLSEVRRGACEQLGSMRRRARRRARPTQPVPTQPLPALGQVGSDGSELKLSVVVADLECAVAARSAGADIVYLPAHLLEEASSLGAGVKLGVLTPVVAGDGELEQLFPLVVRAHERGVEVCASNLAVVGRCAASQIPFVAEESLNVFNPITCGVLAEFGAVRVCASPELTLGEVRQLCAHSPVPVEVKAHGFQRLMLSKNDLVGELIDRGIASETDRVFLRDERGYEFRIVRKEGRTVIYNSIELCMLTHMRELMDCGADVIRLELGLHEREEVERIVSAYRRVMDGGTCVLEGRYTTGHHFRGVE